MRHASVSDDNKQAMGDKLFRKLAQQGKLTFISSWIIIILEDHRFLWDANIEKSSFSQFLCTLLVFAVILIGICFNRFIDTNFKKFSIDVDNRVLPFL